MSEPQIKCPLCGKAFLLHPRKKDGTTRHGYTDVREHITESYVYEDGSFSGCQSPRAAEMASRLVKWQEDRDDLDQALERERISYLA